MDQVHPSGDEGDRSTQSTRTLRRDDAGQPAFQQVIESIEKYHAHILISWHEMSEWAAVSRERINHSREVMRLAEQRLRR